MKLRLLGMFVVLTLFTSTLTSMSVLAVQTEKIVPCEDTYTYNQTPQSCYALNTKILVGSVDNQTYNGYATFSLPANVDDDDRVLLLLHPSKGESDRLTLYGCKQQDLISADITYNSASVTSDVIGIYNVTSREKTIIDVSDYVLSNVSTRKNISFALMNEKSILEFLSSETTDCGIVLQVEYGKRVKQEAFVPIDESTLDLNVLQEEAELDISGPITIWDDNEVRAAKFAKLEKKLPDNPEFDEYINVDEYTTTYYKPWLANRHITSVGDVLADRKGGEMGQRITCGAVSPSNPNHVFLGTDVVGLWKSEDFGTNWHPSSVGVTKTGISSVAFDPDDENIVYCIASGTETSTWDDSGVYKSTDGGKTWTQKVTLQNCYGLCLSLFAFTDKNEQGIRTIYAASYREDGVVVSYDGGETWENIGMKGRAIYSILYNNGELIITSPTNGVEVSKDGGKTWQSRNEGFLIFDITGEGSKASLKYRAIGNVYDTAQLDIDPKDSNHWIVTGNDTLYESFDRGFTWKVLSTSNEIFGIAGVKIVDIAFSPVFPDGSTRIWITGSSISWCHRYSDDGGKTFNKIAQYTLGSSSEDSYGQAKPLLFDPKNTNRLICVLSDAYKSLDGGVSVYPSYGGLSGRRMMSLWVNEDDYSDEIYGFTDVGMEYSLASNNGELFPVSTSYASDDRFWIRYLDHKSINGIVVDPNDRNRVFIVIGNWRDGTIKVSNDRGLNFEETGVGTITNSFIQYHKDNSDIIYTESVTSYDNGITWKKNAYPIKEVSPFNNDIVYSYVSGDGVYKSSDCGKTWEKFAGIVNAAQIITADSEIPDRLYIGSGKMGLAIVEKDKVTYKGIEDGLTPNAAGIQSYYNIVQDPNNPKHLVTCGHLGLRSIPGTGIHESFDRGETWHRIEGMVGPCDAHLMHWHPDGERIFIVTSAGTMVYFPNKVYDMNEYVYLDVKSKDDSYAMDEIEYLFRQGISNQYHDGYFKPKDNMPRWEFVSYMANILGIETYSVKEAFGDVGPFSRHYPYVQAAYEAGLLQLNEERCFNPYNDITYQEAATILVRMLKYQNAIKPNQFENISIENVYENAYTILGQLKVIDEKVDFKAHDAATREDLAYMVYNAMNLFKMKG